MDRDVARLRSQRPLLSRALVLAGLLFLPCAFAVAARADDALWTDGAFPELGKTLTDRDRTIAEMFSPVFYQAVGEDRRGDYITNFDFDGDWVGNNNWANLESKRFPLKAYIYYSVVETETHFFVTYAAYHAVDCKGRMIDRILNAIEKTDPKRPDLQALKLGHENDMEGAVVVVQKQGNHPQSANVVAVETLAHNQFYFYRPLSPTAKSAAKSSHGVVLLERTHPILFVEARGHGVTAYRDAKPFAGRQGLIYRYKGVADDPDLVKSQNIGYDLIHMYPTLWKKASENYYANPTFGDFINYGIVRNTYVGFMGAAFKGERGGVNRAKPPWGWSDGQIKVGDWFLDPARVIKSRRGWSSPFSLNYIHHPYLGIFFGGQVSNHGEQLLRHQGKLIRTDLTKAATYLGLHEPEKAVDLYRLYLRMDPGNYDVHCALGLSLLNALFNSAHRTDQQGENLLKAAEQEGRIAISLSPARSTGHSIVAVTSAISNQPEAAIHEANQALSADSENALAHLARGLGLKQEGRSDEAIRSLQKYLGLNPTDVRIGREVDGLIKARSVRSKEIEIHGDVQWIDTEIEVAEGERISIRADGQIRWGRESNQVCGPDGVRHPGIFKVMPDKNTGALIGKIQAKEEELFFIGGNLEFTVKRGGRLYLGINDDHFGDNSGSFTVHISRK